MVKSYGEYGIKKLGICYYVGLVMAWLESSDYRSLSHYLQTSLMRDDTLFALNVHAGHFIALYAG